MKQIYAYTLDLTKVVGGEEFSCPRCGAAISPDDCTEELYSILEAKVNGYGLVEAVIRCNRCKKPNSPDLLFSSSKTGAGRSEYWRKERRTFLLHYARMIVLSKELVQFCWIRFTFSSSILT
jgi:predicted nucleic acid-binding Zn ribbon protein